MAATEMQEAFLGKLVSEFSRRSGISEWGRGEGREGRGVAWGLALFPSLLTHHGPNTSPNHRYPKCPLSRRELDQSLGVFRQTSPLSPRATSPTVPRGPTPRALHPALTSWIPETCIGLCTVWALPESITGKRFLNRSSGQLEKSKEA